MKRLGSASGASKRLLIVVLLRQIVITCALLPAHVLADPLYLVYEIRVPAGDNPDVMAHSYYCTGCTPETWPGVIAPEGSVKEPLRFPIQARTTVTPLEPPPGVPARLDLSPEVPGAEMVYIMRALSVRPIGYRFSSGTQVRVWVERINSFIYEAGSVVHELTDTKGDKWILFGMPLSLTVHDPAGRGRIDPTKLGGLKSLKGPWFWTYSSRVLEEDLVVSANGKTEIIGQLRGAAWQRVTNEQPAASSEPIEKYLDN